MSLETPEKIRTLQRKLYCKAKAEPAFRFYLLYDKICREDILRHAYRLARANAGAPGVDGVTFAQIEAVGLDAWLASLREEVAPTNKTDRPPPARRGRGRRVGGLHSRSGGAANFPWASRRSGIGWFKPPPSSCWNRSSRQISMMEPM